MLDCISKNNPMKYLKFLVLPIIFFGLFSQCSAYHFPNDSITVQFENPSNGSTILSAQNRVRTILYVSSACREASVDVHLVQGSSGSTYFLDSENNQKIEHFLNDDLPANTAITWNESASSHCFGNIVYVDYDLSSVPNIVNPNLSSLENSSSSANQQLDSLSIQALEISENLKFTNGLIYFIIIFSIVYFIGRFIFRIIQDYVLGW